MTVFEELKRRGLLAQLTDEEEITLVRLLSTLVLTQLLILYTLVTLWRFVL